MSNASGTTTYRWKGKIVTKKIYETRIAQQKNGRNRRIKKAADVTSTNNEIELHKIEVEEVDKKINKIEQDEVNKKINKIEVDEVDKEVNEIIDQKPNLVNGRRIVDLKLLGEQMWCACCKQTLSFQYVENEQRRGFGSILSVRCHNCSIINQVSTSKQCESKDKRSIRYETNYKAVLGALHSELGWSQFSKIFACLNIPCLDFKTYKKYETEIKLIAEKVIEDSCVNATSSERKLTLKQTEKIAESINF